MTPERWQQIDRLLELALEQKSSQRADFLAKACAGDEDLRREVEALLAAHEQTGSFIEAPALAAVKEAAEQRVAKDQEATLVGQNLGHYEVLSVLGEGGMGVVYKARDKQLGPYVAIKVLPAHLVSDSERKKRFVQEAKAASALNHPNIVTIHEIARDKGMDFIVMEHVVGKTLDRLIPRKGMRLNEALKIAIAMADALTAAHAAGIVHRDLKPGNVMVGEKGQVKVLDLGLAKLIHKERIDQAEDTKTEATESGPKTEEGAILGTASYMSPEQAFDPSQGKGRELARIDIPQKAYYSWELSPDGSRIAISTVHGEQKDRIRILSLSGGGLREVKVDGWTEINSGWSADGKGWFVSGQSAGSEALLHVDSDGHAQVLWQQPISRLGGLWGAPSPDGRYLAFPATSKASNAWLIENF